MTATDTAHDALIEVLSLTRQEHENGVVIYRNHLGRGIVFTGLLLNSLTVMPSGILMACAFTKKNSSTSMLKR